MAHPNYSSTSSLPLGEQRNPSFVVSAILKPHPSSGFVFAEQEWGSTALALHQALSALAPSQSLPGTQRPTAHPGHSCQATTVASTSEPPQAEGASNQLNSSELSQTQQTGVDGTSAAVSADLQGAKCTGADVQRSQTAVAQGYHFATDLLGAFPFSMNMCACSALLSAC